MIVITSWWFTSKMESSWKSSP